MKLMWIVPGFLYSMICSPASAFSHVENVVTQEKKITVNTAEKAAIKEFKRRAKGPVTRISVRLLEENDQDWVFVVEDEGPVPVPGSELYVTVSKKKAKAESYFGK